MGRPNEAAINLLVADMLALPDAPASLMEFLDRHSDGNPFFVAEYLRAAVADGLLYREAGRWQVVTDLRSTGLQGRMALPSSLRDLEPAARGLDDDARRLAEAAPTRPGFRDRARAGYDRREDGCLARSAAFSIAVSRRSMTGDSPRPPSDPRRRVRPHRDRSPEGAAPRGHDDDRIDVSGRRRFPVRSSPARHWEGADVMANAVEYLDKAGDFYALRTSAYMDTVRLFGKAADLSGRHRHTTACGRRTASSRSEKRGWGSMTTRPAASSGPRRVDPRFPVAGDEGPKDSRPARRACPAGHPSSWTGPRPGRRFRPSTTKPPVRMPACRSSGDIRKTPGWS